MADGVWLVIVSVLILLAQLCVLGLTLKLYTEYFKDKSQDRRRPVGSSEVTDGR